MRLPIVVLRAVRRGFISGGVNAPSPPSPSSYRMVVGGHSPGRTWHLRGVVCVRDDMTDKVVRFPVIEGGGQNSGEAEVMVLLGKAADANLTSVCIFGIDAAGDVFEASNATELEQVGMHMTAMLGRFFED